MLVIQACVGVKPFVVQDSSNNRVVVNAFAKLGGKHLGKIVLPTNVNFRNSKFKAVD